MTEREPVFELDDVFDLSTMSETSKKIMGNSALKLIENSPYGVKTQIAHDILEILKKR